MATDTELLFIVNGDPVALDDRFAVGEGETLTIAASGFLANDLDPDGGPVTGSALIDNVDNGTLNATTSGSFTYTPNAGFVGEDSFTYDIVDAAGNRATATVFITVFDNLSPVAADDFFSTRAGETLTIAATGFLANDLDPEGGAVTGSALIDGVDNGTLNATTSGSFTYTPDAGFVGTDSFTYDIVDDEGQRETATVFITVTEGNRTPVAADDSFAIDAGETLTIAAPGFLANDVDPDGDAVSGSALIDNVDNGTLNATTSGSFTYTPDAGFVGIDSFTYDIVDSGGLRSTATVWISVGDIDDPMALDDTYIAFAGQTLTVAAPGFLTNDFDAQGGTVTGSALIDNVDNGTLNATTSGSFTYTPDADFIGTDSFTYDIVDADGNRDTATVAITVVDARRAPVAVDDSFTMFAGDTLTTAAPGFLANDLDPDGGPVTGSALIDNVDYGTLNATTSGSFTYTPDAGFIGTDSFTYDIVDGDGLRATATVHITVIQDPPPIGVDDLYAVAAGATLVVDAANGFTANDVDPGGGPVTGSALLDNVDNGTLNATTSGSFTYTPDAGFAGIDSFTYDIVDSAGNRSGPIVVRIGVYGQVAPIAADDMAMTDEDVAVSIPVLANDADPNGDALTITGFAQGGDGTVTQNGNMLVYTPDLNFFGSDSFTYTIADGNGGFDTATVSVEIAPVNDAPVAMDDAYMVTAGDSLAVAAPGVLANDSDVENDPLTAQLVSAPSHGALAFNPDGSFVYTPDTGFAGDDEFIYVADDGDLPSAQARVDIEVERIEIVGTPQNDRLVGSPDAELFRPLGGKNDQVFLGGGMDIVEFGSETMNGEKDITQIFGFSSDDSLDLGGATVESFRDMGRFAVLTLSGDGDRIFVFDVGFDELVFV